MKIVHRYERDIVAGGSDIQHMNLYGIGKKQIGRQLAKLSPLIFVQFRSQKAMWFPSSLSVNTNYDLSHASIFFPSLLSLS
jgi:hypothetical protein